MNEQSESESSSVQVNSQNNYKYDKYGFVLVNSIEDLLYDKFNNQMEKDINIKKNKNEQKHNGNDKNPGKQYNSIPSQRRQRNKENIEKSMKIILNINNKDKKVIKINPNDSKSIETNTAIDKETDSKNNSKNNSITNNNKNNIYINKNRNKKIENIKKEKAFSHKRDRDYNENFDEKKYENDEQFTFCKEEKYIKDYDLDKIRKFKKKYKKKNSIKSKDSEELDYISENDNDINIYDESRKNKSRPKNMKKTDIKKTKNYFHYSLPVLSPCIISKIRKANPNNIKMVVPKSNREFITKTYENETNKEKKKILTWPNSTVCYFNRSNQIINVNIHIPMQNVVNRNYFCTKEIVDINKRQLLQNNIENGGSSDIIIKIVNPENSPFKYGKIDIKTGSGQKSNSKSKSYVFKIRGNKEKKINVKNIFCKNNSALSRSRCLKNKEIRNAFEFKKSKSKTKKKRKEKLSPECLTLKRRKKFGDKLYKRIIKKKSLLNPNECLISIKTKFKNNMMNNYGMFQNKKEEEKIARNNSMNKFELNNQKNLIYPYINRGIIDENKSLSYINAQRASSGYPFSGQYNPNFNNDSQYFPAINSYFH